MIIELLSLCLFCVYYCLLHVLNEFYGYFKVCKFEELKSISLEYDKHASSHLASEVTIN